jgi:hypothetical protein
MRKQAKAGPYLSSLNSPNGLSGRTNSIIIADQVTLSSGSLAVTFPQGFSFSDTDYVVVCMSVGAGVVCSVADASKTVTGFTLIGSSSSSDKAYYIAIGA